MTLLSRTGLTALVLLISLLGLMAYWYQNPMVEHSNVSTYDTVVYWQMPAVHDNVAHIRNYAVDKDGQLMPISYRTSH